MPVLIAASIFLVSCVTVSGATVLAGGWAARLAVRRLWVSKNPSGIATSRLKHFYQQPEFLLVVIVRNVMLVERVDLNFLIRRRQMMVHREDRARRADIVAQAIRDHR